MDHKRGMDYAHKAAQSSDDPDTQVGCAIFNEFDMFAAWGTNKLPKGIEKTPERVTRPAKYDWIEHAERNAIYSTQYKLANFVNGTVYITWFPCCDCAKALVEIGIKRLVYNLKEDRMNDPRYKFDVSKAVLEAGGVELIKYEETV